MRKGVCCATLHYTVSLLPSAPRLRVFSAEVRQSDVTNVFVLNFVYDCLLLHGFLLAVY